MKKVILFIFFCYALTTVAQRDAIDEISKASEAIRTVQCNFRQTKITRMLNNAMVSEGKCGVRNPTAYDGNTHRPTRSLLSSPTEK